MRTTTAATIIKAALSSLGIVPPGSPLPPDEGADNLMALNRMLDAMRIERLYAYATTDVTHTTIGVTASLTIGVGGNINIERPESFEAGCHYSLGGVDYPLEPITEAEYNAIPVKGTSAVGGSWFEYSPTLPLGVLKFFPALPAGASLKLPVQVQLTEFADLSTPYTLPSGYENLLALMLTEVVSSSYGREIPPTLARRIAAAKRDVARSNFCVPQLKVFQDGRSDWAQVFGGA